MNSRQKGRQLLYEAHLAAGEQFSRVASSLAELKKDLDPKTQDYLQVFIDSALDTSNNHLKLAGETNEIPLIHSM